MMKTIAQIHTAARANYRANYRSLMYKLVKLIIAKLDRTVDHNCFFNHDIFMWRDVLDHNEHVTLMRMSDTAKRTESKFHVKLFKIKEYTLRIHVSESGVSAFLYQVRGE
ncbi:hypothetical protein QJS83_14865 [Bdellovibrio sp. 22V]|uniref:hypothetical protein n=1 Tax=Bdellovibrio sp. 22V TaxID=3044166 RepID=UPI0025435694|nr:hypothetical protein [Bdellovibrio sp. 22V]WII71744.1 hypothetical protein QJS83_14865 [Bdellovibrio sp. 22V]